MFQLIAVVIAIALAAALAVVSINYLPTWQKLAGEVDKQTRITVSSLEQAYDVAMRATDGIAPAVTGASDGGFAEGFLPVLRFLPAHPTGYAWVYGVRPTDGTPWSNLNYFCLSPITGSNGATEGVLRGLMRAQQNSSDYQFFISAACGDSTNWATPATLPALAHVTFFVAYTPGLSR